MEKPSLRPDKSEINLPKHLQTIEGILFTTFFFLNISAVSSSIRFIYESVSSLYRCIVKTMSKFTSIKS